MPGLTITFTDEELAALRAQAAQAATSMKAYAHDTVMNRVEEAALREGYRRLRAEMSHDEERRIRATASASAARIASEAGA